MSYLLNDRIPPRLAYTGIQINNLTQKLKIDKTEKDVFLVLHISMRDGVRTGQCSSLSRGHRSGIFLSTPQNTIEINN